MGTWDVGSLQNDAACEWVFELEETTDLSHVERTLRTVVEVGAEYLEAPAAAEAIAAAETIARLKGHWGLQDAYSESLDGWVRAHAQHPPEGLVVLALEALDRIVSEPSELLELWSESDEQEWRESVADLRSRVAAPADPASAQERETSSEKAAARKWWQFWK